MVISEISRRKFDNKYLVWFYVEDYQYLPHKEEMLSRGLRAPMRWILVGVFDGYEEAVAFLKIRR